MMTPDKYYSMSEEERLEFSKKVLAQLAENKMLESIDFGQ